MSKWVSFLMLFSCLWHLLYQDKTFSSSGEPIPPMSVTLFGKNVVYIPERILNYMNWKYFTPVGFLFACVFGKHWFYWCLGSLAYQSDFSCTLFLTPRSDIYYSLVEIKTIAQKNTYKVKIWNAEIFMKIYISAPYQNIMDFPIKFLWALHCKSVQN